MRTLAGDFPDPSIGAPFSIASRPRSELCTPRTWASHSVIHNIGRPQCEQSPASSPSLPSGRRSGPTHRQCSHPVTCITTPPRDPSSRIRGGEPAELKIGTLLS